MESSLIGIVDKLIAIIIGGGSASIVAILIIVIGYLVYEKRNLDKKHEEIISKLETKILDQSDKDKQIFLDIIDRYHQGQTHVLDAIKELQVLLNRIDSRL